MVRLNIKEKKSGIYGQRERERERERKREKERKSQIHVGWPRYHIIMKSSE